MKIGCSYSAIQYSCMCHTAVVDLTLMFFNFPRLTANYKLQSGFQQLGIPQSIFCKPRLVLKLPQQTLK